ncbi:MAG TPA: HEAT repeat domain-containing protein, partial [Gemmataceae bacterium]|nr:HEAT repeat domain-containing protein [Gemmataceae bacterium]
MRGIHLAVVMLLALSPTAIRADSANDPTSQDEQILRAAHVATDDVSLLDVFRKRLLSPTERRQVEELIRRLNDDDYSVREEASADLVEFGSAAVPLLRKALKGTPLEVSRRAKKCIQRINPPSVEVLSAAARLLGARHPKGALDTLLNYLPVADDDELASEIRASITALAFKAGEPRPALVQALRDPRPVVRGAAVDALCQGGGRRSLPLVRPLLTDRDADVRLRVAHHLAGFREADAIPALIALTTSKGATAEQADAYLRDLAETEAPADTPGTTEASRRACRDAWQRWWQAADGSALLDRIRAGTPDETARQRASELIGELGDDDFVTRERATDDLVTMGAVAVPLLQKAAADSKDCEVAHRAASCLTRIAQGSHPAITATTMRLVAFRKPPGAASVLLAYLPFANGSDSQEEVQKALTAVAYPGGAPDP